MGLTKYIATYWAEDGIRCMSFTRGVTILKMSFLSKVNKLIPRRMAIGKNIEDNSSFYVLTHLLT